MTNKKRYVNAFRSTIKKYLNPIGEYFFSTVSCPICIVTTSINSSYVCIPCPMANYKGKSGCDRFRTFRKAEKEFRIDNFNLCTAEALTPKIRDAFIARAIGLEKILKVIEGWPNEQFTTLGWKFPGKEFMRLYLHYPNKSW